ncbi:MAG TPA: DNA primase [Gammaproteobacteria bacterium]|nr:DNA primase [Gammaproteobacteria bacterium]
MAGRIPQAFLDELIGRTDIVELIDARVPLKKAGREYAACCPFHNEKTPSFYVSPQKQFYHCFGCGAHGNAIGFLMAFEHLEFIEAVRALAELAGLEVPQEAAAREGPGLGPLFAVLEQAALFYKRALKQEPRAIEYLKRRGVSGDIAAEFGIGYAPAGWETLVTALGRDEETRAALVAAGLAVRQERGTLRDRFRDRIMFPIRDARGRVIAFGGRILDQGEPKYLNSPETALFHKGRELYGLYEARQVLRHIERLLVVEGYLDVVALAQHGIRYAVATLGTATTAEHLTRLFRVCDEVLFCFDGDRAGRQAAWRALENVLPAVRDGRQIRFLFLPDGEDPDSLVRREGAAAFEARLGQARPLSDYLLDHLQEQVDMASIDGRARLVELAKPLLARIPDAVYRQLLTDRLAELARLDAGRLSMLIGTPAGRPDRPVTRQGLRRLAMTPLRRAIALLLAEPALAQSVPDPDRLRSVEPPGTELLADLIAFLRERPSATAGLVLEHWRGSEHGEALARLAAQPLETPPEGYAAEFEGVIAQLERERTRQALDRRLSELQGKRPGELTAEERAELNALLARK